MSGKQEIIRGLYLSQHWKWGNGRRKDMDILKKMDPELREAFLTVPSVDNTQDLVEIRKALNSMLMQMCSEIPRNDRVIAEDMYIPGPTDSPDVHVRLYSPAAKNAEFLPAVLYMHAGGFFFGNIDICDAICTHYVDTIGCMIVSVDYRLAPENPYPAAPEDCYAALRWMFLSGDEFGINRDRIALYGSSAGGGLAAAVALMARDRKEIGVAFQLLVYPSLDSRATTPSSQAITDSRVWNKVLAAKSWRAYLGNEDEEAAPSYASPAAANDLSGLPSAYIAVCELDILRDEAIDYARRLCDAGVSTELHVFPGTFHAFDVCFPYTEISIRFDMEITSALKRAFAK
jgi:acetyl esterase/lipase